MSWLVFSIIASKVIIEIVFFMIGASIFSFLNVVIYRLPRHMGFVEGKSMCPKCGHTLYNKDLIPIVSWLSLRGKCRYCGTKISVRYTIVEVLGGLSAVLCTMLIGINIYALLVFLVIGILTVFFCILYDKRPGNE